MKKLILPFLAILFILSCIQESGDGVVTADGVIKVRSSDGKVAVCHNGHVINVSVHALPAYLAHGDVIDSDGDGFFSGENDCDLPVDCNDEDPDRTESCCPQGYWCGHNDVNNLNILFQDNCDAIFYSFGFVCADTTMWDYLGSNGNVHTYHTDFLCNYSNCTATVVEDGASLMVSLDCLPVLNALLTPCTE